MKIAKEMRKLTDKHRELSLMGEIHAQAVQGISILTTAQCNVSEKLISQLRRNGYSVEHYVSRHNQFRKLIRISWS